MPAERALEQVKLGPQQVNLGAHIRLNLFARKDHKLRKDRIALRFDDNKAHFRSRISAKRQITDAHLVHGRIFKDQIEPHGINPVFVQFRIGQIEIGGHVGF